MGLKVAMVSPYFVRCGIATYSEKLNTALAKLDCEIFGVWLPRFGNKDPSILENVVDAIPTDKIDLIHVQHEYGLYMGLEKMFYPTLGLLKKPVITTMHSAGLWQVDKVIAEVSNAIIVHNKFCARRFGFPQKTGIIPHGTLPLETPLPPKEACKKSLGIQPATPIVGYLGFISEYKGLEVLIEAMIKVPNAGLLIAGGWHTEEETQYIFSLKEYTLKVLPKRCQWHGYVSDEHVSRVYGAMDIVCYPSRFITESGALLMALSHNKPVIASDLSPTREKAELGALMTFKSTKDLTRKIKRLLKNHELRQTLEEGAKRYVEATSWAEVARRHIVLYNKVLNHTAN